MLLIIWHHVATYSKVYQMPNTLWAGGSINYRVYGEAGGTVARLAVAICWTRQLQSTSISCPLIGSENYNHFHSLNF